METELGFEAPNASKAEVTGPLLPSKLAKLYEKPASPIVSSLISGKLETAP